MTFPPVPVRRVFLAMTGCLVLMLPLMLAPMVTWAATSAIAQSFRTQSQTIANAALVASQKGSTDTIEPGTTANASRLIGVVGEKPLIELSGGEKGVQVVTSGITPVLVSDINGKVAIGDKITASPIEGVGMKATESTVVVGTAQEDLDRVATAARTITDKKGASHEVHIGQLAVQVGVAYYAATGGGSSAYVPEFLQNLANSIAGKNVSPIRVMVAGLIVLLIFISVTVLLYSAVRSSLLSIGRNPLSENAVRKGLAQVGVTALAILGLAVLAIYVILAL